MSLLRIINIVTLQSQSLKKHRGDDCIQTAKWPQSVVWSGRCEGKLQPHWETQAVPVSICTHSQFVSSVPIKRLSHLSGRFRRFAQTKITSVRKEAERPF